MLGFLKHWFLEILTHYISGMDNKSKKACKIELWFEEAEKIEEKEKKNFFSKIGKSLGKRSNDENQRLIILMLVIVVMMAERWQWAGEEGRGGE